MARAALLHINYGPYHIARAKALALAAEVEPHFIQVAARQDKYPWVVKGNGHTVPLVTLSDQPYERSPFVSVMRRLYSTLNALNPDVVVPCGYSEYPMLGSILWARARRKPVVLLFETTEHDQIRSWRKEFAKRMLLHHFTDAIFCGGKTHRHYLDRLGVASEWVWGKYDVVDNGFFQREKAKWRGEPRRRMIGSVEMPRSYFLYVGRFSPEKNLLGLLRAYRRYRAAQPEGWGLVMVGDGPQRQRLHDFAQEHGLADVIWTGFKQADELAGYYSLGSCFVLPSVVEPWGLVVNEAMASGLPVLISDRCGCAPDLVHEGRNGFTFDPMDEGQLAHYMSSISSMDEAVIAEMGKASLEIIGDFTPEAWSANLSEAIAAAMSRSGRGMRS